MKTKAKYEIEQAASTDDLREALYNVHLDVENKLLVATDGRILVVVPAEIDKDEIGGPITPEAFKSARKGITPKQKENGQEINIVCQDTELKTYTKNGLVTLQRPQNIIYPKYKQIIPTNEASIKITFNPELLMRIAKAIGSKKLVTLEIKDELSPIKICSEKETTAFGILMPMRKN